MRKGSYYILLRDQTGQKYKIEKVQGYILEVNDLTFGLCRYGNTWRATTLYNGLCTFDDVKLCLLKNQCIKYYSLVKHLIEDNERQKEYKRIYDDLISESQQESIYERFTKEV